MRRPRPCRSAGNDRCRTELAAAMPGLATPRSGRLRTPGPGLRVPTGPTQGRRHLRRACSTRTPPTSRPTQQSAGGFGRRSGQPQGPADVVARCITAGVPTTVYSVSLGGFDTHADERDAQKKPSICRHRGVRVSGQLGSTARGRVVTLWCTPSSAGGSRPTPRRAPTTARPARCSSPARGSRAALRRAAVADRPGRRRPEGDYRLPRGLCRAGGQSARRRSDPDRRCSDHLHQQAVGGRAFLAGPPSEPSTQVDRLAQLG